jgi:acyl-coenzyme A thioesterase PaaI-like protein
MGDVAFEADGMCFACGPENPVGLHLTFHDEGEESVTTFVPARAHQGYKGIVHGGLIATVLDEVMVRHVWQRYGPSATARLDVRYRHPAPTETPIEVRGWITAIRRGGRAFETAAVARLADGTVLAEATGLAIRLP